MEKRCFRCLCTKEIAEFYRHAQMGDGHLNKCIDCTKSDANKHRLANLERIRAYDKQRASLPHRVAKRHAFIRQWQADHPDRRKAQTLLGNAVRSGRVVRWPCCAVPECDKKPEGHHFDYSQPLEVVWLCRAHHMQAHAINDERAAA
jgi:hypothetical protein